MLISRHDARDAAEGVGIAFIATVTAVVFAIVIGSGLWAFGVFTSGTRGHGDVIKQNNSGSNQIAAQAEFNRLWGDIQADHDNIQAAAATLKASPSDAYQQSVLTAEQQTCRTAVQQYNADTADTTLKEWRPADDPAHIDSATECETAP